MVLAVRNVLKLWLLVVAFCTVLGLAGWRLGG
jgi:hypothetical protein